MRTPELSIVIPCHNERDNIPLIFERFQKLAPSLPSFELVFIDDGSTDETVTRLRDLSREHTSFTIRLICLSRNFGHQLALLAGMRAAEGRAVVTMDADLQDPPETIPAMVDKWKAGFDVVLGQRTDRTSDTIFKRLSAHLFYKIMSGLTKAQFPPHVGDFRLVDRKVVDILKDLKEMGPYWRGLVIWVGYKRCLIPYARAQRLHGETKYPFLKMASFATDAIFSFSKMPLKLVSLIGILVSVGSILFGMTYVILKIMGIGLVPGWASLLSVITFLGGLQLVCLGVLGEYVGRIYEQVLGRPTVLNLAPEIIVEARTLRDVSSG